MRQNDSKVREAVIDIQVEEQEGWKNTEQSEIRQRRWSENRSGTQSGNQTMLISRIISHCAEQSLTQLAAISNQHRPEGQHEI